MPAAGRAIAVAGARGTRLPGRRLPPWSARVAGVDYLAADLARPLAPGLMQGVTMVVHCAAETAGGKDEHERNSIAATRHVIEAAGAAGVRDCLHVSSVAVLKPGGEIDEATPVDAGTLARGPYVWGKAESEALAQTLGPACGVRVKVVRLGPLVDYDDFQPPGRLGRELGPAFVAVGGKRSALSVCDVRTAARVFRSYAQDPDAAPPLLNLVEAPAPTRAELVARLRQRQPDLRTFWFPGWLLRLLNGPLKLAQRLALGSSIDSCGSLRKRALSHQFGGGHHRSSRIVAGRLAGRPRLIREDHRFCHWRMTHTPAEPGSAA